MTWHLITEYATDLNIKNNLYEVHLGSDSRFYETLRLKNAAEFNAVLNVLATKAHLRFNDEDKTIKGKYISALPRPELVIKKG